MKSKSLSLIPLLLFSVCFEPSALANGSIVPDVYGPKPFDQILTSSFSTTWTTANATAVDAIANLKHVIFVDKTTNSCLSIEDIDDQSALSMLPAANVTSTYGSAMRCMFQLLDQNVENLKTLSLNGTYSIHPELNSYSALDGNATSSSANATNLVVRDIQSFYSSENASYLVFSITGTTSSAKIKATKRFVLSSGNFSQSQPWDPEQWLKVDGQSITLTANEADATPFFLADATELIDISILSESDFNPSSTPWQTNAFASYPTNPAPWDFSASALFTSLVQKIDPYYASQLGSSSNASTAAATALESIAAALAEEGSSLRYDKSVYLAFRENALSHLFASQDIFNSMVGERTVAHIYFTNATDDDGIHHPYMVIATHNATPRPNFLIDVARPPGDGDGGGYEDQSVTRTAVLEVKTILIPLKDYGVVDDFTNNILSNSLAQDAGLTSGNYTVENYADIASMGVAIDGVVIYPALNNTLLYATAAAEITSSGAHVGRGGALHYHADGHAFNGNGINLYNISDYSSTNASRSHPPIIGFGYDGIALYGRYESDFSTMEGFSAVLDEFGGHDHAGYGYHYHSHSKEIDGLIEPAGPQNSIPNFTQHFLMVGAWKGLINALPVKGVSRIDDDPAARYLGKNGTAPVLSDQTIGAFTTIEGKVFGDDPYEVATPTSSSNLSVVLSVKSGPATVSGNTITLTGSGTVVLAANQAGNASFNAAPEVTTSFNVTDPAPVPAAAPAAAPVNDSGGGASSKVQKSKKGSSKSKSSSAKKSSAGSKKSKGSAKKSTAKKSKGSAKKDKKSKKSKGGKKKKASKKR